MKETTDKELENQLEGLFSGLDDDQPQARPAAQIGGRPAAKADDPFRLRLEAEAAPAAKKATPLAAKKSPEPASLYAPAASSTQAYPPPAQGGINWRLVIWAALITLVALMGYAYSQALFSAPAEGASGAENQAGFAVPLNPTPSTTPSATPTLTGSNFAILEPTATPTPLPGGQVVALTPAAGQAGWLVSEDPDNPFPNHFGDAYLYAGRWQERTFVAAVQFDLADIPRGAEIHQATLSLTGLLDEQLARKGQGSWQVQLLPTELDYRWQGLDYRQVQKAEPWDTLKPVLKQSQLAEGETNRFELTGEQLTLLERRLLEGHEAYGKKVSFLITGPQTGDDNLFAWDGGHGAESDGNGPKLFLSVGPPPVETPPPYYVVVTSTPTPDNVITAEAISVKMTAEARLVGTATPLPPYWVTPIVATSTPLPANQATAAVMNQMATAVARTTGQPINLATASPTPTYVIITSTPTPLNLMTAEAQAVQVGVAATLPANWVTPFVVTSTPEPRNTATAQYIRAVVLTTGTPELPANVQTATPTPPSFEVALFASPTATATPSPTPQPLPPVLMGKILFLSDREGATEEERARAAQSQATPQAALQPFAYDPATGQLERLTAMWPYEIAAERERWSPDESAETYAKELLWTNVDNVATEEIAIHVYDYNFDVEEAISKFGAGIAYDPVWSPVSDEIALVATESGNDEIWVMNRDGTDPRQLTRNEWEWDKHPTWSPDGQQIVFYSNRTGNTQLWIMNKDGSDQRLLMEANPYNDWDPVWVKYLDPAPPANRLPDWRFVKPEGEESR